MKTIIAVIFLVFAVIIGLNAIDRSEALFYASLSAATSNETSYSFGDDTYEEVEVKITGQVNKAGTYTILSGSYLIDLIDLAGGITSLADESCFDYYFLIENQTSFYIPPTNENGKVSINTALLEELMSIKGIGKVIGNKIISYRDNNGNFLCLEEIMEVDGIGASLFDKIKDSICL